MLKIFIGADHRGFQLKEKLLEKLREKGYMITDLGSSKYDPGDDYTDLAIKVGKKVVDEKARGILICRSGIGMCMVANKVKGVRAGLCTSIKQARLARTDDDINVLCLSSEMVTMEKNLRIINKFINTVFSCEERYIRRIKKIKNYES